MRDGFGRPTEDLRISLTQRCNLTCVFCHMEGQPPSDLELTPEEFERCVIAAKEVGVERVKLTGGEPTLRTDLVEIVRRLRPHVKELSMTTNGIRLAELARPLVEAGLDRVNISLPSALPDTYRGLTGAPALPRVLEGIRAAGAAGLRPLKLNVVVLAGITEDPAETRAIHSVAAEAGAAIQFIEFENVKGRVDNSTFVSLHAELSGIDREASRRALKISENRLHHRPSYTVAGGGKPLTYEIVRPVNNPEFCAGCYRVRLTSYGALKGCLMTNAGLVEMLPAIRRGAPPKELVPFFEAVVRGRKPFFRADGTLASPVALPTVNHSAHGASVPGS